MEKRPQDIITAHKEHKKLRNRKKYLAFYLFKKWKLKWQLDTIYFLPQKQKENKNIPSF